MSGFLLRFVTDRAAWVLVAVALLVIAAATRIVDPATGALRIGLDASVDSMLPEDDEGRAFYETVRQRFGSDETLVLALVADDVFSVESLRRIERLTERVSLLEGVHHVVSLSSALSIRSDSGDLVIEPFLNEVPESRAAREALRAEALSNRLYRDSLVSADGRASALIVHLHDLPEAELLALEIDRALLRIAEEERGDAAVWLTGGLYLKAETGRLLLSDLARTIPLAIAVVALVALVCFRTLRGVVVTIGTTAIALVWTLAAFPLAGQPLNLVTVVVPTLVIVLGFAYAVHVVAAYYDVLRDGEADAGSAVAAALRRVAVPVALTGLTTGVGLLSLATSRLGVIQQFALFSTFGVAATVLASLSFAPALLQVLPAPKRLAAQGGDGFDRLARALAGFDVRRRVPILAVGAGVAVIAIVGTTRIRVRTEFVEGFPPESRVEQNIRGVRAQFPALSPCYIVLATDHRDAFKEPEVLRAVESLQQWLEEQPEIGRTTSLVDYVRLINQGFHDGDPAHAAIPASKRLVSQLLFFGGNEELDTYVDPAFQVASVLVRTRAENSEEMTALMARIDAKLAELSDRFDSRVTGNTVLLTNTIDDIARGQALSLSIAFVAIFGILALIFTSPRAGLVALVPNALPVLVYFGILGFSGVSLNATTGLVACLVLGIAVDDTIHFFARFNEAARRHADETRGVVEALRTVGRPVTYTTVALCLGFGVLATSSMRNQVEFGVLAAVTLAVAWLIDVTFTPALAARMRIVTLWDALTLDLGEDPHRTIPFFQGLSKTQARIAALLTRIQTIPKGEHLFRRGDRGREMYVVIGGRLRVYVDTERGPEVFGTMERGDVVGEVGLFHGRRTANVDVEDDARLLRFSPDTLERIRRRYPRTGAQLYANLSTILAQRVASTTEHVR